MEGKDDPDSLPDSVDSPMRREEVLRVVDFVLRLAFLAPPFLAVLVFTPARRLLRDGAAFLPFLALLFDLLAFLAMIASRSVALEVRYVRQRYCYIAATASSALAETILPAIAWGVGPPLAQSTSSTV
jgi:hypothetical protein